jgi:hypothetical protein
MRTSIRKPSFKCMGIGIVFIGCKILRNEPSVVAAKA